MARTIKEIYNESIRERNKRLELSEFSSDSKLSVMNGLTWAFSAIIYSFEVLLDVFAIDISNAINSRINGTPNYYANALLQYQKGDVIKVREDGLAFGYEVVDETKRIITQVSYSESSGDANLDNKLILKVATGEKGKLSAVSPEELLLVNAYIDQIKFTGTRIEVTSLKGDVLIPRVSVYYDGAVLESEIYDLIDVALNEYIMNIEFDAGIYVSKVIEAIRGVEHVTDVHIDTKAVPGQGIFVACYDSDGRIGLPEKINRLVYTNSGYIRESTGRGDEKELPNFRQSIKLIIDKG
ncbi:MAG: hypothetical protein LBT43_14295 [Prevotella sp.]|jgi:hypothetical protein|nr:hypothetical protein [Prevotella sp.]